MSSERKQQALVRMGVVLAMLAALCLGLVDPPRPASADTGSNWTGAYFANKDLQGAPAFTRIDPALIFNWGPNPPGPGLGSQNWSARWTTIQFLNAGTYRFSVTSDDGVRVYINGQNILDRWIDQAPTTYQRSVQITATGNYAIQVEYYQSLGDASLAVSWQLEQTASTAWSAQYYNNPSLQGAPVLTRAEYAIDYFWGLGSPHPAVAPDYFSARWTATLPFNAGTYRFTIAADDGVRFYIDDILVMDQRIGLTIQAWSIDVQLSAGLHTLRLEYFEITNQAVIRLNYELALGPPPVPGTQSDTWYGEYYANMGLSGTPSFVRLEQRTMSGTDNGRSGIAFNWNQISPRPGFPREYFSVRWTRRICEFPGRPTVFYLTTDDGARLYIDNTLVIDVWRDQSLTAYQRTVDLTAGCHTLRLEYYQRTAESTVVLTWNPPDGQFPAIPVGYVPGQTGSSQPPTSGVAAIVTGASYLNVRSGPGSSYDILTTIQRNQTLVLSQRNADNTWVRGTVGGTNITGWVRTTYVSFTGNVNSLPVYGAQGPSAPVYTGVRAQLTSGLRLRTGPSTLYPAVTILEWGLTVDVVGRSRDGQWLQVRYGSLSGWILSAYTFVISGSLAGVPITG